VVPTQSDRVDLDGLDADLIRVPRATLVAKPAARGTTAARWADEKTRTDDNPRVQVACQPGVLVVKERVEEGENAPGAAHGSASRREAQLADGQHLLRACTNALLRGPVTGHRKRFLAGSEGLTHVPSNAPKRAANSIQSTHRHARLERCTLRGRIRAPRFLFYI
jgi:hypothetical protein